MATPTTTKHSLPGALGPILVDVRAAGRSSARPAVLVVHGFKGFKDWGMFPVVAERIARSGCTAVSFNVSGSGVDDVGEFVYPERFGHNTFSAELADIALVLETLRAGRLGVEAPSRIGLLGHSRGGGMGILCAAEHPAINALVTWAAISHVDRWPNQKESWRAAGRLDIVNTRTGQVLPLYPDVLDDIEAHGSGRLNILGAAARIAVPWLILHGAADPSVAPGEGEALAQAAPGSRLLILPEAGHTFGAVHPFNGTTPQLAEAIDETVKWFGRNL
jgi:pimeloyl-ACP methyl ester carboxylesterase